MAFILKESILLGTAAIVASLPPVHVFFFIFLWTRFWPPARYNSLMVAQSAHPHGGLHVIESDKEEIPWNYEVGNPSHIVRTDEITVTFWDVWQEVLTALGLLG